MRVIREPWNRKGSKCMLQLSNVLVFLSFFSISWWHLISHYLQIIETGSPSSLLSDEKSTFLAMFKASDFSLKTPWPIRLQFENILTNRLKSIYTDYKSMLNAYKIKTFVAKCWSIHFYVEGTPCEWLKVNQLAYMKKQYFCG